MTHSTPPAHFRPMSERQRREVLRRIDAAELATLRSVPGPITVDPYLLDTGENTALTQAQRDITHTPLRLVKPTPHKHPTQIEQYEEAERIHARMKAIEHLIKQLAPDLEPMPAVDHRLRRVVWTGIALYMLCVVVYGIWIFTR